MTSLRCSGGGGDGGGGSSGSGGGHPSSRCGAARWVVLAVAGCDCSSVGASPFHPSSYVSGTLVGVVAAAVVEQLRNWYVQHEASRSSARCPYIIRTGDRAGQTCGTVGHTQSRCLSSLSDTWCAEFGDAAELPRWLELVRQGVDIFALDYNDTLTTMYALSASVEGDCHRGVPPDPGIAAATLSASESGTLLVLRLLRPCKPSRWTQAPLPVSFMTAPLSLLSLHLSQSDWLTPLGACTAALQGTMVTTTTPGGQRESICTCTRTGHHLATFTRRPGSSLYTLATKPPQVAASAQVSASSQVAASCSCRLLSHQTLLWHHRLGHPSLPRLRGMHSRLLVSSLPRSRPPLPPSPAPPCLPCVEGRQRAAPHSSFPLTTAPLHTLLMDVKGEVVDVLIPWIRTVRLQLRERFSQDLLVLRLHSDRGGEFSSNLLRDFCCGEGILHSFTLLDSPQRNGIAKRRIGLVMEVAHTSMIHATAPHFLWPFAVRYAAHQLNLWPCVSLPETSPTLRWTGQVASVFRVWGSRAFVRDTSADNLSPRAIPCVFLGFPPDAPGWQFYHPTLRCIFPSQDVTFDESVPFYRHFPYRSAPPPPPPLFLAPGPPPIDLLPPQGPAPSGASQVDPLLGPAPVQVAVSSGAARGVASGGAASGGAESGGVGSKGAETGGVETRGAEPGGAEPKGVETGGAVSEGAESGGAEPQGAASSGATGAGRAGAAEAGGTGVVAGAGVTRGTAATGPGGPRTQGTGAAGTGGVEGARAGDPKESGATDAGGFSAGGVGAGGAGIGGTGAGGAGVGGTGAGGAGARGAGAVDPGGAVRPRPYFIPLLQVNGTPSSIGLPPRLLCPPPDQSQPPLQPASPLFAPSPYTEQSGGLTERREPTSRSLAYYATTLVAESVSASPPSVRGECALGTDVLEDRQEDFECLAAAVPRFASMMLAHEGDSDAPDIPTPRSYAEAITGTYVDEVPPPGANIVDGMWIFRVKRPLGSPPAFKARYVARGFNQRQGVDYFQTFSPTPKMTTLQVLLHVAAQCDYELHSQDISTAFLQGSLHEEIWLRRPRGFTGSFPVGTQWSLRRPVYHLRQVPREWYDTLSTTLAALGFSPSTADPTLHSLSAPPSDESVELSGPYPELVGCLMYLMTCTRPDLAYPLSLLARYVAPGRHRKVHWDVAKRVLRYLCTTWGMGLVLGGRGSVVLTGHADASWVDDSATQRSSQGYTFSLGSGSISWRSTRSSSALSSSCEAEIYAGAMAAQELRWLTYLLTDLGEQPRSPPVLYVDNKAMIALC
ncbi:unnamed protein product [Closterium sp. NIES-53]